MTAHQRVALARKLQDMKPAVATEVADEFYRLHPDWLARYGERGQRLCVEDSAYHLDFLAGAVEAGAAAAFADYARWVVRVLHARGIEPRFVVEDLRLIELALAGRLDEAEKAHVAVYLQAGSAAAAEGPHEAVVQPHGLFLQAILQGQRQAACAIALEAARAGGSLLDVYADVLQAALYDVGRLWETNRISVAQEHMATAIVQLVLAQLYPLVAPPAQSCGNAVITGVEGEMHQVGANLVADSLEVSGWNVRFLGTNMPPQGVLDAIEKHTADVVGISATMLFSLAQVRRLVSDVRRTFTRCPRIVVGGAAFRTAPDLAEEVGADGYAPDLRAAVALLGGWAGRSSGST